MATAIITGAGTGIGRAAAMRLAKDGFAIALVGRRVDPLEEVAAQIRQNKGHALVLPGDVTRDGAAESIVQRTVQELGSVDVLINNAGAAPLVPLAQLTPEKWREVLEINLSAAFYLTRAAWPIMVRQQESASRAKGASSGRAPGAPGGVIVNISSMSSKDPFSGLGAYGAAKAGLNVLTLMSAREGHDVGIRAVCIAPGAVDTQMFRGIIGGPPAEPEKILQPEEVAELIAQAVSGAVRYCSGETIFIHKSPA